ncbi:MAG: ATP-binding protein, partial [Gammaproteobacteria bacterium]
SVEISVSSVPSANGTVVRLYVTDMTDGQHYLDAVESSRDTLEALVEARTAELGVRTAEYQDLYENAPDMYASISPLNASIIKCNNRLALKTGYSKAELVGMKVFNLYHPDSHADAQETFDAFVKTGFVASRQLTLMSKEGKRIPVLLNVDAVRDSDGNITQSRSTWVDISDVEMLKKENKTFVLATQGSEIGIWDWDFLSGEQNWSAKFHELLGYPASTPEKLSFDKPTIVHSDDREALTALFKAHFADEQDFNIELRLQTFDNDYRWFHLQGKAVRDIAGKVIRMVGSARDVDQARLDQDQLRSQETELKEINEQLAKSNDHLEQFAYITSHDLKAPLRGIATLVTFMEEDLEGILDVETSQARAIRGNLVRLARQATRMEGLISGVLDYSRVDSVGATFEDVDVKELLADVAIDQQLEVGRKLNLPEDLPVLRTDPVMFEQVFSNLISNAAKFHLKPDELKIDIGYECDDEFHTFSVSDNGPGIRPEFHLRIFDMFQTLHSKDTYESTGIGLTLVKRIVEKFGGRVFVESVEGKGAKFGFTWPVVSEDPIV